MTDTAAPGWYPDPAGTGGTRWWDGTAWAAEASAPVAAPARATVPERTPVDTVWIWLVVGLPLVSAFSIFLLDVPAFIRATMENPATASFALIFSASYLAILALGWVIYGLLVLFAYFDYRELGRRGFPRRFHWAWAFLSSMVYSIGRPIVVKQQAGRGSAPIWGTIAVFVLTIVVATVWTIWLIVETVDTIGAYTGTYSY